MYCLPLFYHSGSVLPSDFPNTYFYVYNIFPVHATCPDIILNLYTLMLFLWKCA
jgi:hypothetical protein